MYIDGAVVVFFLWKNTCTSTGKHERKRKKMKHWNISRKINLCEKLLIGKCTHIFSNWKTFREIHFTNYRKDCILVPLFSKMILISVESSILNWNDIFYRPRNWEIKQANTKLWKQVIWRIFFKCIALQR